VRQARFRRSPFLVIYWTADGLVVHNYATGIRAGGSPVVVRILSALDTWTTRDRVTSLFPEYSPALVNEALDLLLDQSIVQQSGRSGTDAEAALRQWGDWLPQAAFFHLTTKDVVYGERMVNERRLLDKMDRIEPPAPLRRLRSRSAKALPAADTDGALAGTLLARRTWRRFGAEALPLDRLSTLLGLTWRVQKWADTGAEVLALKTAPSGGARHNLEAYVLALRVADLEPGIYHYDANAHTLKRVRRDASPADIARYVPRQPWYEDAACMVLMTSVFGRAQWRYEYPRAYRSVLLEAGHFCQNFLLLATSLGLAPFCTGALADATIERDLGIDGVSESVIYACGVGTRPPGVEWAPWPETTETPRIIPPVSARPGRKR
jgi:SagB-type dehydrogenase family enzyme